MELAPSRPLPPQSKSRTESYFNNWRYSVHTVDFCSTMITRATQWVFKSREYEWRIIRHAVRIVAWRSILQHLLLRIPTNVGRKSLSRMRTRFARTNYFNGAILTDREQDCRYYRYPERKDISAIICIVQNDKNFRYRRLLSDKSLLVRSTISRSFGTLLNNDRGALCENELNEIAPRGPRVRAKIRHSGWYYRDYLQLCAVLSIKRFFRFRRRDEPLGRTKSRKIRNDATVESERMYTTRNIVIVLNTTTSARSSDSNYTIETRLWSRKFD